jgi:UDP-N-acetylglucosamine--N-acetylmuramyl-(pentapeptide) pyrophosphoryl-undecaprenol N-acetylglucosamine transferase
MSEGGSPPLVVVAAGGTGGHLFPAEALAVALRRRGVAVALATDSRATRFGSAFAADKIHVIPSDTVRSSNLFSRARSAVIVGIGVLAAWLLFRRLNPAIVVGFGGYPTVPPLIAATLRGIPTLIHDANAVMGRANRFLAPRVTAIATAFDGIFDGEPDLAAKTTVTGNPVRPAVVSAAIAPYDVPDVDDRLRLLIFGGSQGARVLADVVPAAVERLDPAFRRRLAIVQQAREEDIERVRESYRRMGAAAEVAPFFPDLPERMAAAHVVISRSGAGTVAELAAIGRPAILVPLPHALDQDQLANATVLEKAGGAIVLPQDAFTPERLGAQLAALALAPMRLATMAVAANSVGRIDAAERLANLVMRVAGLENRGARTS